MKGSANHWRKAERAERAERNRALELILGTGDEQVADQHSAR